MAGFLQALPHILESEGGYAAHPADPGGATMKGVTEKVYHDWLRALGLPLRPVKEIGADEVQAIYHGIWRAAKCDALPWPVSFLHFDAAVNSGTAGAARMLQRVLEVGADGKIGPGTLAAVQAMKVGILVEKLLAERERFFRAICERRPESAVFLAGWLNRVARLRKEVAGYLSPAARKPLEVTPVQPPMHVGGRAVPDPERVG